VTHEQREWHIRTVAKVHKIGVVIADPIRMPDGTVTKSPYADQKLRQIHIWPIVTAENYYIGLHELGHLIDKRADLAMIPDVVKALLDSANEWRDYMDMRREWRAWKIAGTIGLEIKHDQFLEILSKGLTSYCANPETWERFTHVYREEWRKYQ
jgi:hypothetical protein